MTHRVMGWVIAALSFASPSVALAGGFEVPDQSAVAVAMGGTGTARRGDRALLERTGATSEMVDGLVGYARGLAGVEIATRLFELDAKNTRASLRAAGSADVSRVAVALGGGGHRAASGATVRAGLDSTRDPILSLALAELGA